MPLNVAISPSSESVFAPRKRTVPKTKTANAAGTERIAAHVGKGKFTNINTSIANSDSTAAKLTDVNGIATYLAIYATPKFTYLNTLPILNTTAKEIYYYHTDHLGSSSWLTDNSGVGVQHFAYLPWGETFVSQKANSFNPTFTFSGKEKDTETGYHYFGSRYYDSRHSIWLSVDPKREKYPALSPYVYCADNPIMLIDPNGEEIGGDPTKGKRNIIKTPSVLRYFGFFVRHPSAAINIGQVRHNSSNISTVATRFATRGNILYGSTKSQDDRGSQNGAFRHTLWQAAITSEYGKNSAIQAGNAHEKDPSVDLSQRVFPNIDDADQVIDLLNNQIGRRIGEQNQGANMQELAQLVLSEFATNGLYTATKIDNNYIINLTTLSESKYIQLKNIFEGLNRFGRTPKEQMDIDNQNKEKLERLQKTWETMK